jgi:hypothetical protein
MTVQEMSEGLRSLLERADQLVDSTSFREALRQASTGSKSARYALTAPREFMVEHGIELPEDLEIAFLRSRPPQFSVPVFGRFVPDFEFFSIRQFNCRTYWVAKRDEDGKRVGYEEVQICFGFEVFPKYLPGGPISRRD